MSWTVGKLRVSKMVEGEAALPLGQEGGMLPEASPAALLGIRDACSEFVTEVTPRQCRQTGLRLAWQRAAELGALR